MSFNFDDFMKKFYEKPEDTPIFLKELSNEIEKPHNNWEELNAEYTALSNVAEARPDLNKEISDIFEKGIASNLCLANPFFHIHGIRSNTFINKDNAETLLESMRVSLLSPNSEMVNSRNYVKSSVAEMDEIGCLSRIIECKPELTESVIDLVKKSTSYEERKTMYYLALNILKNRPEFSADAEEIFPKEVYDKAVRKVQDNKKNQDTETSELITSKISLLRAIVEPNISKEKGVVNPKMSAEEKKARLDSASKILQGTKIKDITD